MELYDFGFSDSGSFYYVMERLVGMDLDKLVSRFGPQPSERVVELLRQACQSLSEAHQAGLVHRDIKPANLYACKLAKRVRLPQGPRLRDGHRPRGRGGRAS